MMFRLIRNDEYFYYSFLLIILSKGFIHKNPLSNCKKQYDNHKKVIALSQNMK